jgi:hypothetical protein
VHQHEQAVAAPLRGDERGAVGQAGPHLVVEIGSGLGEDLAADLDGLVDFQPGEGAGFGEGRQRLGLFPGQRAAQRAVAPAQLDRDEIVVAAGEPRAGKAHQDTAAINPALPPAHVPPGR